MPTDSEPRSFLTGMQLLSRLVKSLGVGGMWLSSISIVAMTCLVTVSTLGRWLFNRAILGSDEISGYLLVACVYLGLAYTLQVGGFIRIESVYGRFKPAVRRIADFVIYLLSTLYSFALTYYFWRLATQSYLRSVRSIGVLEFPLYIPQTIMALGISFLTLQLLLMTVLIILDRPAVSAGAVSAPIDPEAGGTGL